MTDDELREVRNVMIVGCGTAYYAGMMAGYFMEQFLDDVAIHSEIASELGTDRSMCPKAQ